MATENEINPILDPEAGWDFASEDDKELGIQTKNYENGSKVKRATLSDGTVAKVRRLKGFDIDAIQKQLSADKDTGYQTLIMARCTTINDKTVVPEEIRQLWSDDYQKVLAMAAINFPIA